MQTFAKLALAAGACALGLGAALPVQAADMGYPEAQAGYPAPPPGYYAPPPAQQGYYPPPPPPAAYGYPPPPPVEYGTYVAPPYVVAPGPYYRAVLARLRTSLCLWLRALARLSALVKCTSVGWDSAKRNPPWARRAESTGFRCAHPSYKKIQALSQLKPRLRIFAVVSSISGRDRSNGGRVSRQNVSRQRNWISGA